MAGSRTLKLSILADVDNLTKNLKSGEQEVSTFGDKLGDFGKKAAAAFAVAAAAAAAYATKLAVDGVKAAIEDEAAQARLAKSLENTTGATNAQIAAVEASITSMSLAFGVADDELRPAFDRLARATGDVDTANKGLNLALDISAATGKSVEAVSNALGKAYEGNTAALGRLGVGLSAAEIKSLGLDGTMNKLAETFGGAASTQADTLEGRIARVSVAFDETKEAIGTALLPIVEKLLTFVTETVIPNFQKVADLFSSDEEGGIGKRFKDVGGYVESFLTPIIDGARKAFETIGDAVKSQAPRFENILKIFKDIWAFASTYLIPIISTGLGEAFKTFGTVVATVVKIIVPIFESILTVLKTVVNGVITAINFAISAYNKVATKLGKDPIAQIDKVGEGGSGAGGSGMTFDKTGFASASGSKAKGAGDAADVIANISTSVAAVAVGSAAATAASAGKAATKAAEEKTLIEQVAEENFLEQLKTVFDVAAVRRGEEADRVIINVNAPSVIDQEGFSRAVVDALNDSQRRTGAGSGAFQAD